MLSSPMPGWARRKVMSKKMPRFESGKPVSASSLNQMSEAIEKINKPDCVEDNTPTYWEVEAKKAFAERDEAKRNLREVAPTVAANEWRKQFYKDVQLPVEPISINFFLDLIEDAEKENKTIGRIDAPPELLKVMRNFGRSVFDCEARYDLLKETGFVGQLLLVPPIYVYLNNRLSGKVRLYLEKINYREYEFPVEPLTFPKPKTQ